MKTHSSQFKEEIKNFGRQLDNIITYEQIGEIIELRNENLNSITPHYKGGILKSVMKQLDFDSNIEIPIGTTVNYKLGLKTRSGKNLLNINGDYITGNITNAGVINETALTTFQLLETGFKIGNAYAWRGYITEKYYLLANEKYTLSFNADKNTFFIGMYAYDNEDNFLSETSVLNNTSDRQKTFTVPNNTAYVRFAFECRNANEDITFTDIQIEKGEEKTYYEKYGQYEYINYGDYIVKEVEKQEDTNSWLIKCCDKMLYTMKDYEDLNITYPITIRNYINTICGHLNLTFKNINEEFTNYNREIQDELYLDVEGNSLGYTFRDVLDELAEVTASTIIINENNELEIRYINDTEDTINDEYLKNLNVNFGKIYGPVNTIILSRSAGADKISVSTSEDIPDDEKIAIEISDNQIMNFDDRSDYISEILGELAGLQYAINDFSSTGICYYEICDKYNIQIDDNIYSCIMFNDEINITQGLEEIIFTDEPDTSEQEYKYMDTTDKRINKTTLTVDKHNQLIEGLIEQQNETSTLLSQTIQSVRDIQNIFQITGGSNLIKNSQFLFIDEVWEFNDETNPFHTQLGEGYDASLIGTTTANAKIQLKNTTINTTIDNINNLVKGQTYTLNYKYKQDNLTESTVRLINNLDNTIIFEKEYISQVSNIENEEFTFVANFNSYTLEIETSTTSSDDGYFYIYDLMLNSGDKKNWEPATNEIYSTILKMSQLGLQVIATGSNIITLLTAQGFQVRKHNNGTMGEVITDFTNTGLETKIAKTEQTYIGKYIMTTLTFNGKQHHVEYFEESD